MTDPNAAAVPAPVPLPPAEIAPTGVPPVDTGTPAVSPPTPPPNLPTGSSTIVSPAGIVSTATDLLTRVLTPAIQTVEGKLAVSQVVLLQIASAAFLLLSAFGVIHPSADQIAEVSGGGQGIAALITSYFVKQRTALKSAATSLLTGGSAPS